MDKILDALDYHILVISKAKTVDDVVKAFFLLNHFSIEEEEQKIAVEGIRTALNYYFESKPNLSVTDLIDKLLNEKSFRTDLESLIYNSLKLALVRWVMLKEQELLKIN